MHKCLLSFQILFFCNFLQASDLDPYLNMYPLKFSNKTSKSLSVKVFHHQDTPTTDDLLATEEFEIPAHTSTVLLPTYDMWRLAFATLMPTPGMKVTRGIIVKDPIHPDRVYTVTQTLTASERARFTEVSTKRKKDKKLDIAAKLS